MANRSINSDASQAYMYYTKTPTSAASGTKQITQNGTGIDVSQYAYADVADPGIVPTGTLNISTDGTYNVTDYASAVVSTGGGGGLPQLVYNNC